MKITKYLQTICRPRNANQRGSAALEVLLLIPFIVLIWALLVNMGYNGFRHRYAQAALRFGAFEFVSGLALMNREKSAQASEASVNQIFFPGEAKAATLTFSGQKGVPSQIADNDGILADASSRETVAISVTRTPPYADVFPNTPLTGGLIIASNTWTYCEMKDRDQGAIGLDVLNEIGKYGLWLFGGCGGDTFDFSCDDRCPK
jgi:hypothetical protein